MTECNGCGERLYGGDLCCDCADHKRRMAEYEYDRELRDTATVDQDREKGNN